MPALPSRRTAAVFFAEVNLTQLILQSSFPHFHDRTLLQRWQTRQQHGVHRSLTQLANLHHGQCAVVGSSGHLLRNRHGRDIDASDMVFRVNAAPTHGFEPYVGSRTDLRIWGARHDFGVDWGGMDNSSTNIAFYCQPVAWIGRCWHGILSERVVRARLSPLIWSHTRDQMRIAATASGISWRSGHFPSSGAITISLALQLCSTVMVFGVGNDSHPWNCASASHSPTCGKYFREGPNPYMSPSCGKWGKWWRYMQASDPFHDLNTEWAWLTQLYRHGRIIGPPCERSYSRH